MCNQGHFDNVTKGRGLWSRLSRSRKVGGCRFSGVSAAQSLFSSLERHLDNDVTSCSDSSWPTSACPAASGGTRCCRPTAAVRSMLPRRSSEDGPTRAPRWAAAASQSAASMHSNTQRGQTCQTGTGSQCNRIFFQTRQHRLVWSQTACLWNTAKHQ